MEYRKEVIYIHWRVCGVVIIVKDMRLDKSTKYVNISNKKANDSALDL